MNVKFDFNSTYFFDKSSSAFNRTRYVNAISQATNEVSSRFGFEIKFLNPMGFEVFNDLTYLKRNLKRFYIYIYPANNVDIKELEELFIDTLLDVFESLDFEFFNSFGVAAARTGMHKVLIPNRRAWLPNDRLLVVEARSFYIKPIQDYSDYIVACISAIPERRILEVERFHNRAMARTRIFQIFYIISNICQFTDIYHSPIPDNFLVLARRHKSIPNFYYDKSSVDIATKEEIDFFDHINASLLELKAILENSKDRVHRVIKSFHGEGMLTFDFDSKLYLDMCNYIESSYYNFWVMQNDQ